METPLEIATGIKTLTIVKKFLAENLHVDRELWNMFSHSISSIDFVDNNGKIQKEIPVQLSTLAYNYKQLNDFLLELKTVINEEIKPSN